MIMLPKCSFIAAIILTCASMQGCEARKQQSLEVAGRIEGTFYDAGSMTGGRVEQLHVDEGDLVTEGQLLVSLDPRVSRAQLAAARAEADRARATLQKLEAGATAEQLDQARAALRAAQAQYELVQEGARPQERKQVAAQEEAARAQFEAAKAELVRIRDLHERLATSQQQLDRAHVTYENAKAQYERAREQVDLVAEGARGKEREAAQAQRDRAAAMLAEMEAGARQEDLAAARAAVAAAEAQVSAAEIQLDETRVTAPGPGIVQSLDSTVGDLVQPGPLVRILANQDLELVVYVTADALGNLSVGLKLPVTADAHDDHVFTGIIAYIASEGEFTPRNLQTQEERAQQVFEVRLRLESPDKPLLPGMSATAHLPNGSTRS